MCNRLSMLRDSLNSLPKTLDETYCRILEAIKEEYVDDAFRILQWLAFSERPVKLEEVAESLAIDLEVNPRFDPTLRFQDAREILIICSSLVTVSRATIRDYRDKDVECDVLQLSHFSVKEYLVSDRMRNVTTKVSRYSIESQATHVFLARNCILYLLQFNNSKVDWSSGDREYPLARYSAQYWFKHARSLDPTTAKSLEPMLLEFLRPDKAYLVNWLRFYHVDIPHQFELGREVLPIGPPLYYTSFVGLKEASQLLLDRGADVNASGGHFSNSLQAAAVQGHEDVVRLLLFRGANTHAWGGRHGTALHAAAYSGHEAIARLLIENKACVNAEGTGPGRAASLDPAKFQWLAMVTGINLPGGWHSSVLVVAASEGREKIVQLLLEKGARMTVGEGYFGTALQAAAFQGREDIVRQLLDAGADVNAQGGFLRTALNAAKRREGVTRLLLERGAKG